MLSKCTRMHGKRFRPKLRLAEVSDERLSLRGDLYSAEHELSLAEKGCAQKAPHAGLFRFDLQKCNCFFICSNNPCLSNFAHFFRMRFAKVVQPAETII